MAEVSGKDLVLIDQWPGPVDFKMSIPTNGFDSSKEGSGNCVTAPLFRPGQKIVTYNDGSTNPGLYTCIYLKFVEGSDYAYDLDADPSSDHGLVCQISAADMTKHLYDDTAITSFWVTSDVTNGCGTLSNARMTGLGMRDFSGGTDSTAGGRTGEWGWYWCGGVCPCNTSNQQGLTDYTRTGGQFTTDGSVALNCEIGVVDSSNGLQIGGYDFSLPLLPGPVGYSLVDDA